MRPRLSSDDLSDLLKYLAIHKQGECDRLPALTDLSVALGISVASLREQLEVARIMGLVEIKPRTGIRHLPYTFRPAVQTSLNYAIAVDPGYFRAYSELRKHIEASFWFQAVSLLNREDHEALRALIRQAKEKMNGQPAQIPHDEHRQLHLSIYRRLDNPFVIGLLEAYWGVYEAAGLDVYTDIDYLQRVWQYHEKIVEAIASGDFTLGYQALTEHMDLLFQRSKPLSRQQFE